ncbi:Cyanate transport protein cynX [Natrialba chahannaoensis JCM 10990]|uniref:Cyanate transport protein cynX n=2 Tax=Natrialba chahannaoensis TaxID=68911 RepID=M0B5I3_9EURY|nr:Cyanate transport protein cynX [Natrialba chahannaoensis JCM 10990]
MGVFAILTVFLTQRLGRNQTIFLSVIVIAGATGMRIASDLYSVLFLSTIGVGIGIAIVQTLLPSVVQEHFPETAGVVTGLYTTALIGGAALAAGLTAPVTALVDAAWTFGLATWTIPAIIGVIAWIPVLNRSPTSATSTDSMGNMPRVEMLPWQQDWAWFLVFFFAGTQILFFSVLTWLPPLYVELGWGPQHAGLVLTVFMLAELAGSLGSTLLTKRYTDRRPAFFLMLSLSSGGLLGIALLPLEFPWLWATLMGVGIGGMFALVLTLPVDYSKSPEANEQLTAMMFGVGYILAATGPYVVGELRSITGSFQAPFIALAVVSGALLFATASLHPDRTITV